MAQLLLIDDDPDLTPEQVRQAFLASAHTVTVACTGAAGLEHVQARPPDVILLDLRLPDQSGLDVYRQIRAIDGRIPVIFVTVARTADAAIGWMSVRRDKALCGADGPCVLDAEAPRAATQIRQRASVTSRVEGVDTVVRSAAVLPPFQRWKLVAIPRSPGGTEPAISAGAASRIHAALEVVKSAIGSACVVVEAPVALRCRSSVGRSLFRICR